MIDEVGADNLFVQYDIYHAQRMEGELAATMQKHLARIGHVQLADNPGRNEPGTGEINYAVPVRALDRIGYTGWIGCEYKPAARPRPASAGSTSTADGTCAGVLTARVTAQRRRSSASAAGADSDSSFLQPNPLT